MKNPFVFDQHVEGESFTGREWIMARMIEQLLSIRNVILLSPKGWGKTSLAREVSYRIWRYHESYRACFVTIQSGMSEKEFGEELLLQILMVPGIRTAVHKKEYIDDKEIFNIPEVFAVLNHIKLIICISGIDNILDLHNPSALLTKLGKIWGFHRNCAYILLGSDAVTGKKSKKLIDPQALKIGRVHYLGRLSNDNSTAFIKGRFYQSGKRICDAAANLIIQFTNQIPYYLQLLAWHCWATSEKECSVEDVETSIDHITGHYRLHFQTVTENLTEKQKRFVQMMAVNGYQPYSRENIAAYELNAKGNVARIYKSMLSKEIITNNKGETIFANPFYKHWLRNLYFR